MSNPIGQAAGTVVVLAVAIILLWLFVFGGIETIVCDRLAFDYLAKCE